MECGVMPAPTVGKLLTHLLPSFFVQFSGPWPFLTADVVCGLFLIYGRFSSFLHFKMVCDRFIVVIVGTSVRAANKKERLQTILLCIQGQPMESKLHPLQVKMAAGEINEKEYQQLRTQVLRDL